MSHEDSRFIEYMQRCLCTWLYLSTLPIKTCFALFFQLIIFTTSQAFSS